MKMWTRYILLTLSVFSFLGLESCSDPAHEKKYGYRLGDMVKGERFRDAKNGRDLHYRLFPDSIASEYMKTTNENNRYDILMDLVEKRTHDAKQVPPSDLLVIHLRIGDIIDNTTYTVKEFLSRYVRSNIGVNYVKPLSYYAEVAKEAKALNLRSVTLIGGFHLPLRSHKKSLAYVRKVREFFESQGFQVNERIDLNADDDFIYMCNAQYFTPSGGGYSKIVKEIFKLKGKTLIAPVSPL